MGVYSARNGRRVEIRTHGEDGSWMGVILDRGAHECSNCGHDQEAHETEEDDAWCSGGPISFGAISRREDPAACRCKAFSSNETILRWNRDGYTITPMSKPRDWDLMHKIREGKGYK